MRRYARNVLYFFSLCTLVANADGSGFYIGGGYAATQLGLSADLPQIKQKLIDETTDSFLLVAGYDISENLGIEGRYYINGSEAAYQYYLGNTPLSGTYKAESIALYAKPRYFLLPMLDIYALIGVSYNDYSINAVLGGDNSEAVFSWGAGAQFHLTDSIGVYVDYTDFGESDSLLSTSDLSSWNLGFTYKF